jgi:hypothetical protein
MLNNLCSDILADLNNFGTVETRKEKIKREKNQVKQVATEAIKTGKLDPKARAYRFAEHETLAGEDRNGEPIKSVSYHTTGSVQWGTGEGKLIK